MNITVILEKDIKKKVKNDSQGNKSNNNKYSDFSKYELKVKKIVNDMISKSPANNSKIRLGIN